jgi:hypothetical protein
MVCGDYEKHATFGWITQLGRWAFLKSNKEKVVKISVTGEVSHPLKRSPFRLDGEGVPHAFPGTGGITYNFTLGDNAFRLAGDHVEPDVSTKNPDKDKNIAYVSYSCLGNEAIVVSGDAKGSKGHVIGKHGGIDHIMIHFDEEAKQKLVIGDKIQVKGWGQGLVIEGLAGLKVYNIDPDLLDKLPVSIKDGFVLFPVVASIPGYLMGSGVGSGNPTGTDYDIITHDRSLMNRLGIDKLRIGDFVAIENHNNSYGIGGYREGAISIGVVAHSDCISTGHGPGIVVIMTSPDGIIKTEISNEMNLKHFLG